MLRITVETQAAGELRLVLEGRLAGPWVEELRRLSAPMAGRTPHLRLDLSALQFADADGLALLRQLAGEAAELQHPSAFVSALLAEGRR